MEYATRDPVRFTSIAELRKYWGRQVSEEEMKSRRQAAEEIRQFRTTLGKIDIGTDELLREDDEDDIEES